MKQTFIFTSKNRSVTAWQGEGTDLWEGEKGEECVKSVKSEVQREREAGSYHQRLVFVFALRIFSK